MIFGSKRFISFCQIPSHNSQLEAMTDPHLGRRPLFCIQSHSFQSNSTVLFWGPLLCIYHFFPFFALAPSLYSNQTILISLICALVFIAVFITASSLSLIPSTGLCQSQFEGRGAIMISEEGTQRHTSFMCISIVTHFFSNNELKT